MSRLGVFNLLHTFPQKRSCIFLVKKVFLSTKTYELNSKYYREFKVNKLHGWVVHSTSVNLYYDDKLMFAYNDSITLYSKSIVTYGPGCLVINTNLEYQGFIKILKQEEDWILNGRTSWQISISNKKNLWYSVQELCSYVKEHNLLAINGSSANFEF